MTDSCDIIIRRTTASRSVHVTTRVRCGADHARSVDSMRHSPAHAVDDMMPSPPTRYRIDRITAHHCGRPHLPLACSTESYSLASPISAPGVRRVRVHHARWLTSSIACATCVMPFDVLLYEQHISRIVLMSAAASSSTPSWLQRLDRSAAMNRDAIVYSITAPPPLVEVAHVTAVPHTIDAVLFWQRHRHCGPILFAADITATMLYTPQFARIARRFLSDDTPSSVLSKELSGTVRSSSSRRGNVDRPNLRRATLKRYFEDVKNGVDDGKSIFISEVRTSEMDEAHSDWSQLFRTPALFQHADILSLQRTNVAPLTPLNVGQILVGQPQTYSPSHTDFNGFAAGCLLQAGEKLWLYGRPEQYDAFMRAYPPDRTVAWTNLHAKVNVDVIEAHKFGIIHQRAGEFIYMPSGWPHAVYNITSNILIGFSQLHPWNLNSLVAHIRTNVDTMDTESLMAAMVEHHATVGMKKGEAIHEERECKKARTAYESSICLESASKHQRFAATHEDEDDDGIDR